MKKILSGLIFAQIIILSTFLFLFITPQLSKQTQAACPAPPYPYNLTNQGTSGYTITIGINPSTHGAATLVVTKAGGVRQPDVAIAADQPTVQFSTNSSNAGNFAAVMSAFACDISGPLWFTLDGSSGGVGSGSIGVITPPGTIPTTNGDPSGFVAGIIKAAISLLLIIAFLIDLLWTIFAGLRFVTAGGDPKSTGQAWSQIYWGLIGMVVVLGSFAIIKLVETFFGVSIISGGIQLPTI